jgi:hypothetical protein
MQPEGGIRSVSGVLSGLGEIGLLAEFESVIEGREICPLQDWFYGPACTPEERVVDEAISGHVRMMRATGQRVPRPRALKAGRCIIECRRPRLAADVGAVFAHQQGSQAQSALEGIVSKVEPAAQHLQAPRKRSQEKAQVVQAAIEKAEYLTSDRGQSISPDRTRRSKRGVVSASSG